MYGYLRVKCVMKTKVLRNCALLCAPYRSTEALDRVSSSWPWRRAHSRVLRLFALRTRILNDCPVLVTLWHDPSGNTLSRG